MTLEEREPEDLGVLGAEVVADLLSKVVIHDVFEIDFVKIVGPWVEHREALVLDSLRSVLHDVVADELEVGLVGGDWVCEVVFVDILLRVSNEGSNGLDAGGRLEILGFNLKVKQAGDFFDVWQLDGLENADEHLLESLQVPVLVDTGVDDPGVENLLGLVGEEVAEVVHIVQLVVIIHVLLNKVGE